MYNNHLVVDLNWYNQIIFSAFTSYEGDGKFVGREMSITNTSVVKLIKYLKKNAYKTLQLNSKFLAVGDEDETLDPWFVVIFLQDESFTFEESPAFDPYDTSHAGKYSSILVDIALYGKERRIEKIINEVHLTPAPSSVSWIFSKNGDKIKTPLDTTHLPVEGMYPFIKEPLIDYYSRYINSDEAVLLLIGPPGTGKTTFIRGLLNSMHLTAVVSYEKLLLESDSLFANFLTGSNDVLVLEDADTLISSRSDGNDMMQKFLNLSDGIVCSKDKKLIFSTNLPNVKTVDAALTRKGRCFDVITFSALTHDQLINLSKHMSIKQEVIDDGKSHYLCDSIA